MAASKPPKHDFAPAWLKIPNQERNKPDRSSSRPNEHRGRREEPYRYYDYHRSPLPRQRSFDSYEDHPRPYVHPGYRHNSFEDDYHAVRAYYPHNGLDDVNQYRSHPVLHRSGSRDSRDGKYHRYPHAQMNGQGYVPSGPGFYEYYHDHHHHHADRNQRDYYNGYGAHRDRHRPEKHHSVVDEIERKEVKKETSSIRSDEDNVVRLDEEFPSLNGGVDPGDQKTTNKAGGNNAWETPPKVQIKSSKSDLVNSPDLQRKDPDKTSNSIYKALVPNKSMNARKTGRDSKLISSANSGKSPLNNGKLTAMTIPVSGKSREAALRVSPTPPAAEILTKRFITQPRNIGDKKSEFLRTLKKTSPTRSDINSNDREDESRNKSEPSTAIDIDRVGVTMESLTVENTDSLSSSLEAEQRLLREMGWKETDEEEEEYVITEDDKKAVENQIRQCHQRNGVNKPTALQLKKSWSPRHLVFPDLTANDLTALSSSSYSDSDSD